MKWIMCGNTTEISDTEWESWKSYLFFLTAASPWSEVNSRKGFAVLVKHVTIFDVSGAFCMVREKLMERFIIIFWSY